MIKIISPDEVRERTSTTRATLLRRRCQLQWGSRRIHLSPMTSTCRRRNASRGRLPRKGGWFPGPWRTEKKKPRSVSRCRTPRSARRARITRRSRKRPRSSLKRSKGESMLWLAPSYLGAQGCNPRRCDEIYALFQKVWNELERYGLFQKSKANVTKHDDQSKEHYHEGTNLYQSPRSARFVVEKCPMRYESIGRALTLRFMMLTVRCLSFSTERCSARQIIFVLPTPYKACYYVPDWMRTPWKVPVDVVSKSFPAVWT